MRTFIKKIENGPNGQTMNNDIGKVVDLEIKLIVKHIADLDKAHSELNILNKAERSIQASLSPKNEECKKDINIICEKNGYDLDTIRRKNCEGVGNELTQIERIIQETDKNDPAGKACKIMHYDICENIFHEKINEQLQHHQNANSLVEDLRISRQMPISTQDLLPSNFDDDLTSMSFDIQIPEEPKDAMTIINKTISIGERIEMFINIFQNVVKFIVVPKEPLKPLEKQTQEALQEQLLENYFNQDQIKLQKRIQKQREQLREQIQFQETQELQEKILRAQTQLQEQMQQPLNGILTTILELLILTPEYLQEIPQELQKQIGESPQLRKELSNKLLQLLRLLQKIQKQIPETLSELQEQTGQISQ